MPLSRVRCVAAQEVPMAAADDAMAREALRASGLFGAADEAAIDALIRVLRIRRFRRAETIFHQGDPGDALFVLASGSVKVVLPSDEGAEPAIVAILGPGEFFGELAILDGAPHSATIVAVEPTETLVLHRDAFLDLIDSDAGLRRALLASLAAEIRRLTGHVEDLHFLDLPGRLDPEGDGAERREKGFGFGALGHRSTVRASASRSWTTRRSRSSRTRPWSERSARRRFTDWRDPPIIPASSDWV
jgi:CRP-like cAMP-binding protein